MAVQFAAVRIRLRHCNSAATNVISCMHSMSISNNSAGVVDVTTESTFAIMNDANFDFFGYLYIPPTPTCDRPRLAPKTFYYYYYYY